MALRSRAAVFALLSLFLLPPAESQMARPPARLSETGLYSRTGPDGLRPGKGVMPYSPQYPLWSDGARKTRWVYLPPGTKIDVSDMDWWEFPAGTKFWKEFAFDGRKVETRLMWKKTAKTWVFAAYAWNGSQTDALLVPESGKANAWSLASGKKHSIPGVADCQACHTGHRPEVLGFSALQLSADRDPNAPNKEELQPGMITLDDLLKKRKLVPAGGSLLTQPPRIQSPNPRTRAALGYLHANCGGCHNPKNPTNRLGLDFKHSIKAKGESEEPGLVTTLDRRGSYEIPGLPEGQTRLISPGHPESSSLLRRMSSRGSYSQMPPLGTVLADQEAVDLIERWIKEDLSPSEQPSRPREVQPAGQALPPSRPD